ncbi:MAG: GIY-YIG nuclease family protein [Parvularculaceae bacterium]|nr:GIY-YIG nuclease family protein [Parvularculaceae bacterium]
MSGWVYIMTNRRRGVLYVGVTANIRERIEHHRLGVGSSFCRKWGLTRLAFAEEHDDIESAIRHEKLIKKWRRAWKFELIETSNPDWRDISGSLPFD